MVRPNITFAVQQCARLYNNPHQQHEDAVKLMCRYLLKKKDKGLVLRPDKSCCLECFVDAYGAGSWKYRSSGNPLSAHSRSGFVIMNAGCPIIWASKMQTFVSLSNTEAEYIMLSSSLRKVISVLNLLNELKSEKFQFNHSTPVVKCCTFEDDKICIEISNNHKTRLQTKHLSVCLHNFFSHIID